MDTLTNSIARYETMAENRVFRALNQLERMQRMRRGEHVAAPASVEVAVHTEGQQLASFGNQNLVTTGP